MATYPEALKAMWLLLDMAGEQYWRDWIQEDIQSWEAHRDVKYHLSAYGGMGSFNDVVITGRRGHNVSDMQEAWVNALFDILKSMCYLLAHDPFTDKSISELPSRGNRYLPIMEGFKHDPADISRARYLSNKTEDEDTLLHGWRCLHCGYAETTPYNVESFLAARVLPSFMLVKANGLDLEDIVTATFSLSFPELDTQRRQVVEGVSRSGIVLKERNGWMQPCPNCGSEHTVVYRWNLIRSDPVSFLPAKDTLP